MSEELEKKWREEFEDLERRGLSLTNWRKLNLTPSGKYTLELGRRYETYIAAKTSSYELKENLRKRGNNLSKECVELQKEIQKRDDEIDNLVLTNKIIGNDKECFRLEIKRQKGEIERLKGLLERAKPLLMTVRNHCSDYWTSDHIQWLKQCEELKK